MIVDGDFLTATKIQFATTTCIKRGEILSDLIIWLRQRYDDLVSSVRFFMVMLLVGGNL